MSLAERVFTMSIDNQSIGTAVEDIFTLLSGANRGFQIHHIHLEAAGVTSAAEVRMRLKRGTGSPAVGSGGNSGTAVAINSVSNPKSATVTARNGDTTQATGTFATLETFQWQVLTPFDYQPSPEDREEFDAANSAVLDLPAVITAVTVSGFIKWSEGLVAG